MPAQHLAAGSGQEAPSTIRRRSVYVREFDSSSDNQAKCFNLFER